MPETPSPLQGSPSRLIAVGKFDGSFSGNFTPPSSAKKDSPSGNPDISVQSCPRTKDTVDGDFQPDTLSPPLSPTPSPDALRRSGRRLKPRKGLSIELNESTLRHYTDYDRTGTPRSQLFSSGLWTANTFGEPDVQTTLERIEDGLISCLPMLDVYSAITVKKVLDHTEAAERLRQFADAHGRSKDVEFLQQVREFNESVGLVASNMNNLSVKFTGAAATTPVRLPLAVGKSINGGVREVSSSILPNLECLFDEAKMLVEQSLALDVYPAFLNQQICLNLQTIGPHSSPRRSCPGFGEAFCVTDPKIAGNPIVGASVGLAKLSGYELEEIINKNCKMFQGPSTRGSCVDRMRDGLAQNHEFTELVLNYSKSGSMYWNLVIVAQLINSDGGVDYYLGGQIDVTEMLEREEDLMDTLGHNFPALEHTLGSEKPDEQQQRTFWNLGLRERRQERGRTAQSKYPPSASRNRFLKSFRQKHSYSDSSTSDHSADISSTDVSSRAESRGVVTTPPAPSPPGHITASPYSRFMVLHCNRAPRPGGRHNSKRETIQLPLAYCSTAALECLGNSEQNVGDVLGRDVFDILSDSTRSSVIKPCKSAVRESLSEGRTAKLELTLGGRRRGRSRSVSLSRNLRHGGSSRRGSESNSEHGDRPGSSLRQNLSLEGLLPNRQVSDAAAKDFVTYWTPLMNDVGEAQWVVVIFVPELV